MRMKAYLIKSPLLWHLTQCLQILGSLGHTTTDTGSHKVPEEKKYFGKRMISNSVYIDSHTILLLLKFFRLWSCHHQNQSQHHNQRRDLSLFTNSERWPKNSKRWSQNTSWLKLKSFVFGEFACLHFLIIHFCPKLVMSILMITAKWSTHHSELKTSA